MTKTRRILAIVCVAVVVVTALTPATADLLCAVLVALDPLFGTIIVAPVAGSSDADPLVPPSQTTLIRRSLTARGGLHVAATRSTKTSAHSPGVHRARIRRD